MSASISRRSRSFRPQADPLDERLAPSGLGAGGFHAAAVAHRHAVLAARRAAAHNRQVARAAAARGRAFAAGSMGARFGRAFAQPFAFGRFSAAQLTQSGAPVVSVPTPTPAMPSAAPSFTPTSGDPADVKNGPLAKAGQDLITVYLEYQRFQQNGGSGTFSSSLEGRIRIKGDSVGIDVRPADGQDLSAFVAHMSGLGMQIDSVDENTKTVEGYLPINQLTTVAQDPTVATIEPNYIPVTQGDFGVGTGVAR